MAINDQDQGKIFSNENEWVIYFAFLIKKFS